MNIPKSNEKKNEVVLNKKKRNSVSLNRNFFFALHAILFQEKTTNTECVSNDTLRHPPKR